MVSRRVAGARLGFALAASLIAAACHSPTDIPAPVVVGPQPTAAVTIPAQGTATTLDIGNWNVEWFGSASNGPTNDALQESNVRDVIAGADLDIWGLEEVVDAVEWGQLKSQLPGYAAVLSNDAAVTNGSAFYTTSEQKVAVVYKSSVATLVSAKLICTANDFDFAGRPPLEVTLRVTLNGATENVVVIVLHMKAFNDQASWQRRLNAASALKAYLDATYPTQKVFVIGDWNDDTDVSITTGQPTPYANFISDAARYTFPTKALSDAHIASTTGFPDFIDHQLFTNEVAPIYVAGSAQVLRADTWIPSYATTTTDHFPVFSRYNFGGVTEPPPPPPPTGTPNVIINEIMANEPGSAVAGEYVELVNTGTADASIGGWTISDAGGVHHTFASGTVLATGKAIVVFGGASAIPAGLTNAVAASTGTLSLNNGGDSVILKNGATTVTSFTYPASLAGTDGVSMNRNPDASATGTFVLHTSISTLTGSPGKRANGSAF